MMILWLFACVPEDPRPDIEGQNNPKVQEEPITDIQETPKGQDVSAVQVSDTGMELKLPPIESGRAMGKQCFLQEMPEVEVGITGLTYQSRGKGLDVIRVRVVENASGKNLGQWMDCETLGSGYFSKPVVELAGVDLRTSKKKVFNGMNWVNLPEGIAFSYPAGVWLFETWLADAAKDVNISMSLDTIPTDKVKHFAGVIEMDMGPSSEEPRQSITCPWEKEVNIVTILGYADPNFGTFSVSCDEKELYSVDSKEFASKLPPIKNFSEPVSASQDCTVVCDWKTETGSICTASVVAYPLEKSAICFNGTLQ